jgi:hypothetical protein
MKAVRPLAMVVAAMSVVTCLAGPSVAFGAGSASTQASRTQRDGPPPAGRYDGQLCVSTAGATEQCGPVALKFQTGAAHVQFSDLVYQLRWRVPQTQMALVLMHGSVQIDGFVTEALWLKQSLRFNDPDKDVRYEVRWKPTAP